MLMDYVCVCMCVVKHNVNVLSFIISLDAGEKRLATSEALKTATER